MHVDGFRFDEGSILARGEDGAPLLHPPVIWSIELDDRLSDTKMIAEAWDAAGLYQVGHFPGDRWAEWNGRFRDELRRAPPADAEIVAGVAHRELKPDDIFIARDYHYLAVPTVLDCLDVTVPPERTLYWSVASAPSVLERIM